MQIWTIENELERFNQNIQLIEKSNKYSVVRLCEFGILLAPKKHKKIAPQKKEIFLTLFGIVHGNESAGVAVINNLLSIIASRNFDLKIPVGLALGNFPASRKNVRCLEKDLNRCFGVKKPKLAEEKRARELEQFLDNTFYFLDFHQTSEKSKDPFFIFPYLKEGVKFAWDLAPGQPIVTHWGEESFSTEGKTSDEYVDEKGGVGITLELGKNGFDPMQISFGTCAGINAINTAAENLLNISQKKPKTDVLQAGRIFKISEIVTVTRSLLKMDKGWYNFRKIHKNQRLGVVGKRVIRSTKEGYMLFPAYIKQTSSQQSKLSTVEMCRILQPVKENELPS